MEEARVCVICGRRPSSVYFQVDARTGWSSFSLDLLGVDVKRLREEHPEVAGVVCLACLTTYRRHDASESASPVGR